MEKKLQRFCQDCDKNVLALKSGPNHTLHFIITVLLGLFTWGIGALFYLAIWFFITMLESKKKPRCSECGAQLAKY